MGGILFIVFFVPFASIVFFIVSLILFCSARRKNRQAPGSIGSEKLLTYRLLLIVSSVIAGVMLAVLITVALLISASIAYM